jgi:GNAT superfamily N-acetyltransferase
LKKDLGKTPPLLEVYVLNNGNSPAGFFILVYSYSTNFAKRIIIIDEIYVKKTERRKGFAGLMFDKICFIAKKKHIPHIEWRTHTANRIARKFYRKYNAEKRWKYYQMNFK